MRNDRNHRITDADRIGSGSLKHKCRDNFAAIELLKCIEAEDRLATGNEKRVLVRYVGWGGLPQVFDPWNEQWKEERERLEALLTPDELESARATTLNAHYTASVVIRAMYSALQRFGFTHGRILEPALGLGHFIGLMPNDMHGLSQVTGVEIDSVTARLAKMLYPDADVRHQPFEESKLADSFYDVAISNIPFGSHKLFDSRFKKGGFLIHDYFFAKALDKVRPGGLILFVTSKGTLDKLDVPLREYVAHQADLLGAIRLPNDAFKKNPNTEVTTDVVMLRKRLAKRIRGLIRVRDAVRRCLCSQLNGAQDEDVVAMREQLNRAYDSFVAGFGPISQRANAGAFRGDPDLPLLLSLEHYDGESDGH